ncbi:cystathionine gamma-lyase-like isoform X8 [Rhincodon typus]|uniref:cystathionine gamma-lyase-like isoform X8 n=1 Tax=Rhincodon typus TaxID=259920 RepID=UPI00202E899D|nr:cystathionine gamma-lyase-like isoform X8 [Rhincodon typus]
MSAGYEESELLSGFQAHFGQFSTQALHIGQEPEQWTSMAMVPSISLSNTSKQSTSGQHAGFNYCCSANLSQNCLEKAVAAIDGAKYSANQYFCRVASEMGVETSFVDCTSMKTLNAAIKPNTKLVWIETPTNPMMKVIDIKACAETAHKHGDIILVVDNTFMTSYFQRPLALGADICMCSATKYMNGHSDVIMGLASMNRDDLYERLKFLQNAMGVIPSPFDCYMCNRGLKTLALRMKQHFKNALAVAKFLEADPRVEKVIFPGLPSHPQYDLIKQQCTGSSGMMAFLIKGGLENAKTFLKNLKLFTLAESLGGYESLAEHSAIMSHSSVPKEERDALGISDTLIRLSIGLEDVVDIIEDLHQALKAAHPNIIKPAEQINL